MRTNKIVEHFQAELRSAGRPDSVRNVAQVLGVSPQVLERQTSNQVWLSFGDLQRLLYRWERGGMRRVTVRYEGSTVVDGSGIRSDWTPTVHVDEGGTAEA